MTHFNYLLPQRIISKVRRILLPAAVLGVLAFSFLQSDTVKVGDDFNYNWQVKDLQGRRLEANDLKGKVLFLNMWATWCGPCREEMPSIEALYKDVTDSVNFVMLSIDKDNMFGKVKKMVKDQSFTFPVYTLAGPLPEQLNVPLIPTTFIVDRSGKIVYHFEGSANYDTKKFKTLLHSLATAGVATP